MGDAPKKKERTANKFADSKHAEDLVAAQERLNKNLDDDTKVDQVAVKVNKGQLKGLKDQQITSESNALFAIDCEKVDFVMPTRTFQLTLQDCKDCSVTVDQVMSSIDLINSKNITLRKIGANKNKVVVDISSGCKGVRIDTTKAADPTIMRAQVDSTSSGVVFMTKSGETPINETIAHRMTFFSPVDGGDTRKIKCEIGMPPTPQKAPKTKAVVVDGKGKAEVNLIDEVGGTSDFFAVTVRNCKQTSVILPGNCTTVNVESSRGVKLYAQAVANLENVVFNITLTRGTLLYAKPDDMELEVPFPVTYINDLVNDGGKLSVERSLPEAA